VLSISFQIKFREDSLCINYIKTPSNVGTPGAPLHKIDNQKVGIPHLLTKVPLDPKHLQLFFPQHKQLLDK